jgi:hypothetical protein
VLRSRMTFVMWDFVCWAGERTNRRSFAALRAPLEDDICDVGFRLLGG